MHSKQAGAGPPLASPWAVLLAACCPLLLLGQRVPVLSRGRAERKPDHQSRGGAGGERKQVRAKLEERRGRGNQRTAVRYTREPNGNG